MFKPQELERIPLRYNKIMRELEEDVIVDIANRILKTGEITSQADWEVFRLHQAGMSKSRIKKSIQKAAALTKKEVNSLYNDRLSKEYSYDIELYKRKGFNIVKFDDNKMLQQEIQSAIANCGKQLDNITRTSGFSVSVAGNKQFTSVHKFFTDELDKAFVSVQNGFSTADKEALRVVRKMINSGFQTVYYDSGVVRSVESAVRMCVMTGLTQVVAKQNELNAEQLGTDMFEISFHSTARPSHMEWQGRVYNKKELVSACGLRTATGLCGINCYHTYYPFIEGISERSYTDEWLDEQNAKANETRTYKGVEYTQYEATQRMREIERGIRSQQKLINCIGRLDEQTEEIAEKLTLAKCKKQALKQEYVRFAEKMELPQEKSRLKI